MVDFSKFAQAHEFIKKYTVKINENDNKYAKIIIERNLHTGKYEASFNLPDGEVLGSCPYDTEEQALNEILISKTAVLKDKY